jgi:PleD family two-component response regulator/EAL domain-containing protein (putative c-di-GMP-specific phosphodiesterase class I)
MHLQADPADTAFHSPVFAAYYAQRLREVRARIVYLCGRAWDINSVWLVQRDLTRLLDQVSLSEPQFDSIPLLSLADAVGAALAQPDAPDAESRSTLLALLGALESGQDGGRPAGLEVRRSENERIEVPPAGFWRRWADDAPPPSWSEAGAGAGAGSGGDADLLGLAQIDLGVMLAGAGGRDAALEIVHERVASHYAAEPGSEREAYEPPDDFIEAVDGPERSGDYDWDLGGARATPAPDLSLDAFWEATRAPQPPSSVESEPAAAPPVQPAPVVSVLPAAASRPPAGAAPPASMPMPAFPSTSRSAPAAAGAGVAAAPRPTLVSGVGTRIYHLTASGTLAIELDQRLEALGYELELLENADELGEVLGALTPDIVIIDAEFEADLEVLAGALRTARQKANGPIRVLVLCQADTMASRLAARRAGADALLFGMQAADAVLVRIEQLVRADADDRYRVLIVEDDHAQGLFAESILRNAGMEAEVVEDGLRVMEAMQRFQPDLVLMDLYMPNCDGTELTALIRERDEFLHTPIVFLSGESDEDKHYEALSAGGDDFLSKPIRPKHLIAAVTNRVRRARSIRGRSAQVAKPEPFDSGTGLHFRAAMLERLEQALVEAEPTRRRGGVMFLGVENVPALRQRLGLTTAEELLEDVAQFIVGQLGSGAMASRYGDGCFLIFDASADADQLRADGEQLREAIRLHAFETPRENVLLELVVGAADLRLPYADAAAVLNAAEHASRAVEPVPPPAVPEAPAAAVAQSAADRGQSARILALLDDPLQPGRLDLDFQPIVALQGGEQAQYQTLLRLHAPDGELMPAGKLLPVVRQAGRLPEFDRWVLARALEVIANRMAMARGVTLFVNQSVEALCQDDYVSWIAERVSGPGQLGESLVIEIDADEIGLNLDRVHAVCTDLVVRGVRFCLSRYRGSEDQDGILHVLPVDLVKIAPDLIAQLGDQVRRSAFNALVDHMHERTVGVIAPRVEDTRTAAVLWMSGIDYIQGNLVQSAGSSLDFDFNSAVL